MEAILDTNFIISCIKKKIDFLSELEEKGFHPVVPKEVIDELKDLKKSLPHDDRAAIDVAFELFEKRKTKKTRVGGKTVDEGLILKGREGIYIATLDNAIRREIKNKIIISSSKNSIEIERD